MNWKRLRKTTRILLITSILVQMLRTTAANASVQGDYNSVCSAGGGTVVVPANATFTSTLNLTCATNSKPIVIHGSPSTITCQTGATPCITMVTPNLSLRDLQLVGPGRAVSGSEGIRVTPTSDYSSLWHMKIDGFDRGLHMVGDVSLLQRVMVDSIKIGMLPGAEFPSSVNIAVHLDGAVANAYFTNFGLSGYKRVILSDGISSNGAAASFVHGFFNTTQTPGVAAVSISSSDPVARELLISDVQDWETACPFLDIGPQSRVVIQGVAFSGDPWSSGSYPAFKMSGAVSWLRITNANLTKCSSPGGDLIEIDTALSLLTISGSDLGGPIHFIGASQGAITGNRFTSPTCLTGNLVSVRASANIGCADR